MNTERMEDTTAATETVSDCPCASSHTPKAKRRFRFGDRKDGRRIRSIPPLNHMIPFFMKRRVGAQNQFEDTIEITALEQFIKRKRAEGFKDLGILHCIIASYVRAAAQRPAINRFCSGQRIYARNNIEGIMTVKRTLSLEGEETETKVVYDPSDSVEDVYEKFNTTLQKMISEDNHVDRAARILSYIPRLVCRFAIAVIRFLDYFGWLPKKLTDISPFHGSFVITSMGSLGINAIFHHLYNFGNVPAFLSYGKKYTVNEIDDNGNVVRKKYITFKAVVDERICDGYCYASAFKIVKRQLLHPELLEGKYENVVEDID